METKHEPKYWKGNGPFGFVLGIIFGLMVGLINMIFLHIWHLGIITWIVVWLVVGMHPHFRDARTEEEIKADIEQRREERTNNQPDTEQQPQQPIIINNVVSEPKQKHAFHGITCPKCGSANVQLISSDANIKRTKKSASLNMNPLHPLTPFNVKEKKVKKRSKGKIAAAVMTGGTSLAVTGGTKSNRSHEYHCQNCGKTFTTK